MKRTADGDARTRFLQATEDMLRETGMAGTGIKDIVARGNAPIGSLYHHFPGGKAQLVGEAIARNAAKLPELIDHAFADGRDPARAVRTFFDAAAEGFERRGGDKGCAVGAVALDLTEGDEGIRHICQQAFDGWAGAIAARLPWADQRTRRSFAEAVVVAMEGAFVVARASRNGESFRVAGRWLSTAAAAMDQAPARPKSRTKRS